ncbi:unnamed protein product [Toxocara canis]|uniref:Uncharacterized protein n=1 Tax=Toxocara canis TaxID=6265 RepID=A0A3P7GJK3_TOXCA|nr:unnamed protein product [Toxocara canis]
MNLLLEATVFKPGTLSPMHSNIITRSFSTIDMISQNIADFRKIFGPLKVFEKRDDSAVPGGAQSPDLRSPHGRGGTSSNEKDANKAQATYHSNTNALLSRCHSAQFADNQASGTLKG